VQAAARHLDRTVQDGVQRGRCHGGAPRIERGATLDPPDMQANARGETNRDRPVRAHFILYVADQERSAAFYRQVLELAPSLHTPGMTEFRIGADAVLGLMPEAGIRRLLGPALDAGSASGGACRAEIYLVVDDPGAYHARALAAGAEELSPLALRDWGHVVAYSRDSDGYVVAFAAVR
jgi:catechol 2,3-dioxygenase-like lactoylglutathione lyase family enzyme